jgi:hypothetical protein
MRVIKIAGITILIYVGIVVVFELLLGIVQPAGDSTLVLTTTDANGAAHERVVSRLDSGGKLYVSANHWPRAWYRRVLENPEVQATLDGQKRDYLAVPVDGEEHERVDGEHAHPWLFRVVTGFPPRRIVRLDPR